MVKTLTWDQGREMARWQHVENATGAKVYFCEPRSPWQRPTNEQTNGLLRRWLPKGTDLNIGPVRLAIIEDRLNTMPRKFDDWHSAHSVYTALCRPTHPHNPARGCSGCLLRALCNPAVREHSSCPDDLTDEPTQESRSRARNVALEAIVREEQDIAIGDSRCYPVSGGRIWPNPPYPGDEPLAAHPNCARLDAPCPDPSPGRLSWTSSHFSQLAVVNSPVTIEILDIPTVYRTQRYGYIWGSSLRTKSRIVVEYPVPDTAEPDNILRLWNNPDSTVSYNNVSDLASSSVSGTSECFLYYLPLFKIIVRELWPDNPSDRLEIDELFGADALQWWDNIPTQAEKERRTKAQGFEWWPNLSTTEQVARTEEMTQDVRCDSNTNSLAWCRWQAPKPGYYKLSGAGAWVPTDAGNRQWIDSRQVRRINTYLSGLSTQDRIDLLNDLGVSTPAEAGINAAMDALLPFTSQDTLFSTLSVQARCPPVDVRVACLRATSSGNYVETEPIGIMIHEMRVSTVTPSG